MTKRMRTILTLFAVSFFVPCLLLNSVSFGQEMPKPGEVIDKSNYKNYKHLFPEQFLAGFENGWDGLYKPISIKVVETKPSPVPKVYRELSEKNRGKYTIDKDGLIAGGYDYNGLPFPGVTKDDKDFVAKVMWNYEYRYLFDDYTETVRSFFQRKGEAVTWTDAYFTWIYFVNRMVEAPKPIYKNPSNLLKANYLLYLYPDVLKNQCILSWRYLDARKPDDMFIYLPSMRRVLRGEAGQRSTPLPGSILSPDDLQMFDGRVQDFTYEFVGEQKVLGVADNEINLKRLSQWKGPGMPWPTENWEIKDVYVIDIKSKNPKYPQSSKRIYIDKENLVNIYYSIVLDRAGKLWKVFGELHTKFQMPGGETTSYVGGDFGIDLQFGSSMYITWLSQKANKNGIKYGDVTPSSLRMRGR